MSVKPLQIVACANGWPTQPYLIRGMNALIDSLDNYGYKLTTLGFGQRWGGLGNKPKLLKKAIENGTIKSPHLAFVDCFDVLFQRPPEEALEQFLAWPQSPSIVWGAEMNCFPCAELANDHPKTDSPFKYLNSGMSIGSSEAYLQILTEMEVDKIPDDHRASNGKMIEPNDQDYFMRKFCHGQVAPHERKMVLDSGCEMFQNMPGMVEADFELRDGKIINKQFQTTPTCIHFAGGSKTAGLMEPFLKYLGL